MIGQAVTNDLPAITTLIEAAYAHYIPILGREPRPTLDDHAARIGNGEHHVQKAGGEIVAVIALTCGHPNALHMFNIAVDRQAQGKGMLAPTPGLCRAPSALTRPQLAFALHQCGNAKEPRHLHPSRLRGTARRRRQRLPHRLHGASSAGSLAAMRHQLSPMGLEPGPACFHLGQGPLHRPPEGR